MNPFSTDKQKLQPNQSRSKIPSKTTLCCCYTSIIISADRSRCFGDLDELSVTFSSKHNIANNRIEDVWIFSNRKAIRQNQQDSESTWFWRLLRNTTQQYWSDSMHHWFWFWCTTIARKHLRPWKLFFVCFFMCFSFVFGPNDALIDALMHADTWDRSHWISLVFGLNDILILSLIPQI